MRPVNLLCGALSLMTSVLFAADQASANERSLRAPLVQQSLLLDIATLDSDTLLAVGERGHMLAVGTNDVQQIVVPTKVTLTAVDVIDNHIWAAGHDATILHSKDAGQTWQLQLSMPELDRPFLDILMIDKANGIAIGAYGLFYRTENGGETWERELHASVLPQDDIDYLDSIRDDQVFYEEELSFILPHFNRLNKHQNMLLLAGEAGLLAVSEDLGKSWQRLTLDYNGSLFDFDAVPNMGFLAAGLRGNLFFTANLAEPFTPISTCTTASINSVVESDDRLFLMANNGVAFSMKPSADIIAQGTISNSEGCDMSTSLNLVSLETSEALLNARPLKNQLVLVSAAGIIRSELSQ